MKLDQLSITQINEYLELLHVTLPAIIHSLERLNVFWCDHYDRNIGNMTLSMGLFLLHPAFHKRLDGTPMDLTFRTTPSFSETQKEAIIFHKCKIGSLVENALCGGTDTVSDHNWPWSLGGPTRGENHLELCKTCNGQKSNSILLFNWHQNITDQEWIGEMLESICKSRGGCN